MHCAAKCMHVAACYGAAATKLSGPYPLWLLGRSDVRACRPWGQRAVQSNGSLSFIQHLVLGSIGIDIAPTRSLGGRLRKVLRWPTNFRHCWLRMACMHHIGMIEGLATLCRPCGHEFCMDCRASGMLLSRTSPRQCREWPARTSHSAVHAGELAHPLYGSVAVSSSEPTCYIARGGECSLAC